jgi:predicted ester cyclase
VTSDQLAKFGERYAEAWSSRDPKEVVSFYATGASIRLNDGVPAPVAEVARSFMCDFPDMIVTFDKLESRGDRIAFHWTLTGTYVANGNRVRISGYELWKIDNDGLIAESKGHFDADDYARQLKGMN